jgi:hypothetical protein
MPNEYRPVQNDRRLRPSDSPRAYRQQY